MEFQEIINKSKEFASRVNAINMKLTGDYDYDERYFDSSSYCPANYYRNSRTGELITTERYVIRGRHGHFFQGFDHEPSDKEINNAIVRGFNLSSALLIK